MAGPPFVLLCADAVAPHTDLDADALLEILHRWDPALNVNVVDGLCARPDRLRTAAAGAERLVLGFCSRAVPALEIQRWARRAGVDPFHVETVSLAPALAAGHDGVGTAAFLLAGSAARMAAAGDSNPEHMRVRFATGAVSRRGILSLPPVVYEPAAAIDSDACVGAERCGLCAASCPVRSIAIRDGRVVVDRETCMACGVCVSRCPAAAITLPGASLPQYGAQLRGILSLASTLGRAAGVLFACRHAVPALDSLPEGVRGWVPVEVPSLGMVTPGWILQALAAGAPAVAVLGCTDELHEDGVARGRVDYCRAALESLGGADAADRVRTLDAATVAAGLAGVSARTPSRPVVVEEPSLLEPAATADALTRLLGSASPPAPLRHASSPLGVVRIDHVACTVCGACASACPTDALALTEATAGASLTLDPAACIACERCVAACPEHAVAVRAETNLGTLARGTVAVKTSMVARCRECGHPVAPEAMLRRLRTLLAGESDDLLDTLASLCPDCRSLGARVP